jgi:DNA-binding NtrC family response regulator
MSGVASGLPMGAGMTERDDVVRVDGGEVRAGPTVLVIDDDEAWRSALKDSLEREGFHVVAVARSEWTLPAVELYQPAVVVLDNLMPGPMIGLELLPTLRRRWPTLPIVMMTAFGGRGTADEALRQGATAYFDKPFRVADLAGEIHRLLGARHRGRE